MSDTTIVFILYVLKMYAFLCVLFSKSTSHHVFKKLRNNSIWLSCLRHVIVQSSFFINDETVDGVSCISSCSGSFVHVLVVQIIDIMYSSIWIASKNHVFI